MNSVPSSGHSPSTSSGSQSNARELELLRQVATGDRAAFKELYLMYHRRLARFLMRMTSRHDLIEEVINDTLWTVWLKAGDFRGDSLVSTWIVGITYRRALKALRRHGTARPMLAEEVAVAPDVQAENENRQWLGQALAELPLEQRMVMEFSYLMGHSCEEIAQIMQCPVNTVKTRMFHAREKLRRSLPRLAGANK
jgi:RNA polymerase sigma-70 factor (ECF subfamily)